MWESVLKTAHLEIQMNPSFKSILVQMSPSDEEEHRMSLELSQSDMFELMHVFLSINRTFNRETMYFDDERLE